jgi:CDP-glycerol glycerophosphotransferase (TagB/SpsB family)
MFLMQRIGAKLMNSLFLLYIDPGTGSMLFSVLIGLLATLYFVSRAAFIKIKFLFSGKKNASSFSTQIPYVIYCEGKQYISVFKPILEEFENRQISVLYYTSVENDDAFTANYRYVKPEYIGKGNTAFFKLNMLTADVCLMTTPGINVYQLKRSKGVKHYAHVLHMASDATMYRLFGIDYFDSILLSGDYQKKDIRLLEEKRGLPAKELVTVGCPYLDVLQTKLETLPIEQTTKSSQHNFTVLVSPSWGKNALLSRYGESLLTPLQKSGFNIIVRPHPQTKNSEGEILEKLMTQFPENNLFHWDFQRDNIISMAQADIMISDFSGIIFDYCFLCDKPFLYVNQEFDLRPYDADDLTELDPPVKPWQFDVLPKIGRELQATDFDAIAEVITNMVDNPELSKQRLEAKNTAWQERELSGKNIVDFMLSKGTISE